MSKRLLFAKAPVRGIYLEEDVMEDDAMEMQAAIEAKAADDLYLQSQDSPEDLLVAIRWGAQETRALRTALCCGDLPRYAEMVERDTALPT